MHVAYIAVKQLREPAERAVCTLNAQKQNLSSSGVKRWPAIAKETGNDAVSGKRPPPLRI
jgi:hypothetical protein